MRPHPRPIVTRNRLTACLRAGVEPRFTEYDGPPDVIRWVVSQNLHRRHLSTGQRAMVADALAQLRLGANQHGNTVGEGTGIPVPSLTQPEAAVLLNVSVDTVQQARAVTAKGTPSLASAVKAGTVSLQRRG